MNNQFDDFININYNKISDEILNQGSIEITTLAFIISMIIALPLNSDQQNALGNFLQLIGQSIETVSGFNSLKQEKKQPVNNPSQDEVNKLKQQLKNLFKK